MSQPETVESLESWNHSSVQSVLKRCSSPPSVVILLPPLPFVYSFPSFVDLPHHRPHPFNPFSKSVVIFSWPFFTYFLDQFSGAGPDGVTCQVNLTWTHDNSARL
jgi:hypothetical protein